MKLCMNVNGQTKVPPGFRFHPTEEELLDYYLRKKVAYENIDLDVIQEVDLNKLEPWDIQDKCNIGSTPQNDWYFFSHKDKKYPTGTRTNRATAAGFWKATGRDKVIHSKLVRIGMRKTLVFYKGRAPHGQKSDWIMHEYRLDDNIIPTQIPTGSSLSDFAHEEGWVVCRVFKKKNYHKSFESPQQRLLSRTDDDDGGTLDHLLAYMDSSSKQYGCFKQESEINPINDIYDTHLPGLDSPSMKTTSSSRSAIKTCSNSMNDQLLHTRNVNMDTNMVDQEDHEFISNWADLDKFVASQLNGEEEESNLCFSIDSQVSAREEYTSQVDIWSLARPSSMDPLSYATCRYV